MASDSHPASSNLWQRSTAGLRVLHVIPSVAPRYGGPSQAVVEMCRALQSVGVEPLIATTDADGPNRLPVPTGQVTDHQSVSTVFFRRTAVERFQYSGALAQWLRAHATEFDLVHIHAVFSHPCVTAAGSCRLRGVPYVVRPLGSLDPWSMRQRPLRKRLLWHLGVKQMLRSAAAIHYTTAAERSLAEKSIGLRRGVVIPLGVDGQLFEHDGAAQRFRQRYPVLGQAPYLLALTRIHPKKGLDLLVRSFLQVASAGPLARWRLVLAGDGDDTYVKELRRLAAGGGAGRRILFTGWLAGDDKRGALQGADLFVLPSRQENFALAVAEAMACGAPVLVSPHVNLADDIRASGAGWVASPEGEEFRPVLLEALRDDGERRQRGAKGREFAAKSFGWPTIATQLVELYDSVRTRSQELGIAVTPRREELS